MVARPCDNQADLGRVLQVQDLTPNVSSVLPAAEFVGVPLRAEGHSVAGAVQGERVREPGSGRAAGMSALVETGALKEAQLASHPFLVESQSPLLRRDDPASLHSHRRDVVTAVVNPVQGCQADADLGVPRLAILRGECRGPRSVRHSGDFVRAAAGRVESRRDPGQRAGRVGKLLGHALVKRVQPRAQWGGVRP